MNAALPTDASPIVNGAAVLMTRGVQAGLSVPEALAAVIAAGPHGDGCGALVFDAEDYLSEAVAWLCSEPLSPDMLREALLAVFGALGRHWVAVDTSGGKLIIVDTRGDEDGDEDGPCMPFGLWAEIERNGGGSWDVSEPSELPTVDLIMIGGAL